LFLVFHPLPLFLFSKKHDSFKYHHNSPSYLLSCIVV
jgi:hypothetical protein